MKIAELVASVVLRSKNVSWATIGGLYGLTQDQIRHRLTTFKKKYNVVDADALDPTWSRKFLVDNVEDSEKATLSSLKYYPGDQVVIQGDSAVVYTAEYEPDDSIYDVYYTERKEDDELYESEIEFFGEDHSSQIVCSGELISSGTLSSEKISSVVNVPAPQYIITPMALVVVRNGQPLTIDKSHKNFDKIKQALDSNQWQLVYDLIDMKTAVQKYSNGRVMVENGKVLFDGKEVHGKLSSRLIDCLLEENMDSLEALSNFMVKCDDNPDARVLSRLFSFMQAKDIRIDKDGDFYAYKVVRNNYLDKHSGTMDNSPGKTVKMKRNQVNPIDSETCSTGLHVCSKSYISHFSGGGDKIVLCKVHPKDVVSVPTDYGDAKMRTCEYLVIKDVTENFVDSDKPGVAPKG